MRIKKDLEAAVGSTLEAVIEDMNSQRILCAFSGDTFVVISANHSYSDTPEISGHDQDFRREDYYEDDLTHVFGIEVVNEWKRHDAEREKRRKLKEEEFDRKQYEQLKRRFENTDPPTPSESE